MKSGANVLDQRRIPKLAQEGRSIDEISRILKIVPEAVKNFMPAEYPGKGPELAIEPEPDTTDD